MQSIKSIISICLILVVLCGCVGSAAREYHPTNFPDTIWATEDESVVIEIGDQLSHRGYINVNGEAHQLFFEMRMTGIYVQAFTSEQMETDNFIMTENWTIDSELYEDGKMVVEIKESKYFNEGDILTFYNIGENTSNDNHITVDDAKELSEKYLPQKEFKQFVRYNRLEKINGKDYHILCACANNLETIEADNSTTQSVDEVKICWIYLDAVTGDLYKLKELDRKEITSPVLD